MDRRVPARPIIRKTGVAARALGYPPAVAPGMEDEWRALASSVFDGEVVLGEDIQRLTIG